MTAIINRKDSINKEHPRKEQIITKKDCDNCAMGNYIKKDLFEGMVKIEDVEKMIEICYTDLESDSSEWNIAIGEFADRFKQSLKELGGKE
jgi:hypothetical protein